MRHAFRLLKVTDFRNWLFVSFENRLAVKFANKVTATMLLAYTHSLTCHLNNSTTVTMPHSLVPFLRKPMKCFLKLLRNHLCLNDIWRAFKEGRCNGFTVSGVDTISYSKVVPKSFLLIANAELNGYPNDQTCRTLSMFLVLKLVLQLMLR